MMTRAFSLIEVLISIVVLALGLLGIAAVFPAVVTQQRTTTDSIMGGSLQESVREYINGHRLLNRPSVNNPSSNGRPVARGDLRGWQILVDNENWSPAVARNDGLYDGNFIVPGNDVTQPGINTDPSTVATWILNADATQPSAQPPSMTLFNEPVIWIPVTERMLPVRPNGQAPSLARPDTQYIWDFAARRLDRGTPRLAGLTGDAEIFSLQDDAVQLAIFIRRKDKPSPRNPAPIPVGEDNNGRPTFDGSGQYSLIREAVYTFPAASSFNPATGVGRTDVLDFNNLPNARYLGQIGQKLVDQWGNVHEVIDAKLIADNHVEVTISGTTQRANEGIKVGNAMAYMNASVDLRMIFTNQIPVSVSVMDVRPRPLPRT